MTTSNPALRSLGAVLTLLLTAGALTACASSAAGGAATDGTIVIRDGALRVPDADCAGSGSFLFAHAGATLTVTDVDGDVVIETELPTGEPLRADDKDYGVAKRVPTFCTFAFDAGTLADGETYAFRIDGTELGSSLFQRDGDGVGMIAYPALGAPITVSGDDE